MRPRVLVLERDATVGGVLSEALMDAGLEVTHVQSAREASGLVRHGYRPHALLIDPGLHQDQAISFLRDFTAGLESMPCIVFLSLDGPLPLAMVGEFGARVFHGRAFDLEAIVREVQLCLGD
jgi:DNA-binding NtrC family response regulator